MKYREKSVRAGYPFPGIGEIVGGSQREDVLMFSRKMKALGLTKKNYGGT
jgi:aspartyl/asparaginyl-tRNA synthetase